MSELQTRKDVLSAQGMYVVKHNSLIQKSRYNLSLMEQKAILYIISKIKPNDAPDSEYSFSIKDFCKTCNLNNDGGRYVMYVSGIIENLGRNLITIDLGDGKTLYTHWFSSAIVDEKNNVVMVSFDKQIRPYLFQLKSFYTQYSLEYVLPMKSRYGLRLYEFLRSVKSIGFKQKFTIEEIKERIGCDAYPFYKDFRKNVLEPALKDINSFTDIEVKATPLKTGKKVSHIEFLILPYHDGEGMERMNNRRKELGPIR